MRNRNSSRRISYIFCLSFAAILLSLPIMQFFQPEFIHLSAQVGIKKKLRMVKDRFFKGTTSTPAVKNYPYFDAPSQKLEQITKQLSRQDVCQAVPVETHAEVRILYQYCPEGVFKSDGRAVVLTEDFTVHEDLARRYNFWRRMYSMWDSDKYILHLAEYPEVVLEILDVSAVCREDTEKCDKTKSDIVKKFATVQKKEYRNLLLFLNKYHDLPINQLSSGMKRVASNMRHIDDNQKYLKASHSIRVQRGQKDFIAKGLPMAFRYLPAVKNEFFKQGVPRDIANLALVESSFNLYARSKAGASGVFQIMPKTGKQYLRVHQYLDERIDPIKAGRAAAKLLKMNYAITGSWPLAITAYNHGVGGIKKGVRITGKQDLIYLIDNYNDSDFGFASKNFYASFLGVLGTIKNVKNVFPSLRLYSPLQYRVVYLEKTMPVRKVSEKYKMSQETLLAYNPDISKKLVMINGFLPKRYELKIPSSASGTVSVAAVSLDQ